MKGTLLTIFSGFIISNIAFAQTIYTTDLATKRLADRIITLDGSLVDSIHIQSGFTSLNEYSELFMNAKTQNIQNKYSNGDIFDINKFQAITPEYDALPQDNMLPNYQYAQFSMFNQTPFLYEYIGKHHFFINPQAALYTYIDDKGTAAIQSSIGLQWRGKYKNRLAYHFSAHYNYEQVPSHVRNYVAAYDAFPNAAGYQYHPGNQPAYSHLLLNAQVSYDILPQYLNANIGYGKFFIGDGIRSLILSSNAAPVPYLAFRTKFWKLEYSNIFFQATSQSKDYGLQQHGENKFVALHYLSANLAPWLNIGLFETVTSSRSGMMELGYFNPAIFYRAMERNLGSPDKMALGITAKVIPVKSVQLYGQFFINEFTAKEFFGNKQYLHNKWGAQIGLKYFNVARINNLDLQMEMNVLRPYAYQHRSNSNYTHYNQMLAHPLGANLREFIAQLHYRPFTRIGLDAIVYYWQQGKDANDAENYGSNPLKNIHDAPYMYGVKLLQGHQVNTLSTQMAVSWEWLPYLHVDIGALYRLSQTVSNNAVETNLYGFLGLRYMMSRKDWAQF